MRREILNELESSKRPWVRVSKAIREKYWLYKHHKGISVVAWTALSQIDGISYKDDVPQTNFQIDSQREKYDDVRVILSDIEVIGAQNGSIKFESSINSHPDDKDMICATGYILFSK